VSHREQLCNWQPEPVLQVLAQVLPQQGQMVQELALLDRVVFRFPLQIDQPEQTLVHRQLEH
jgi:hypothetical protein